MFYLPMVSELYFDFFDMKFNYIGSYDAMDTFSLYEMNFMNEEDFMDKLYNVSNLSYRDSIEGKA